jgi:type IV secretion system protein VirD4
LAARRLAAASPGRRRQPRLGAVRHRRRDPGLAERPGTPDRPRPQGRGLLRYAGAAHLLTLAPTRSGKGVGSILPNLLTARRSVIVVDPKGENARVAGPAQRRLGRLLVLDPFALTPWPSAAYNPLAALEPDGLDLAEDAAALADALVLDPPSQVQDAHWNEEAKALLTGLILLVACHEDPPQRHLGTLREHLTLPPDRFAALLALMQRSAAAHGLVARAANRHLAKSDREAAGVLSSAQRHTHFLDSPRIQRVLHRSDFRFAELKHELASVFLVLPPDRLDTYSRWLRLLLAQGISEIARDPAQPKEPVLFLLDEFAALGHLAAVERAMGLMAGHGLQLWPVLQDLGQLEALYGRRAASFAANAGVLQAFNTNDLQTARWLSELLGETTVPYQTRSHGRSYQLIGSNLGFSRTIAGHLTARRLLTPDEVLRLDPDLLLIRLQGRRPILARKLRHHRDPEFRARSTRRRADAGSARYLGAVALAFTGSSLDGLPTRRRCALREATSIEPSGSDAQNRDLCRHVGMEPRSGRVSSTRGTSVLDSNRPCRPERRELR